MGSITFNCICPASEPMVTVVSFPMTLKQICFTTSGITGFTLPGMMEEPGCIGGRLISLKPVLGPEERILKSLQILESLIAKLFNAEEYATYAPVSGVASTKSFAKTMGYPVILQRCLTQACA